MSQCPFSPALELKNSNLKERGEPLLDLLQPLVLTSHQSILKPSNKDNIIQFTPPSKSLKVTFQTPIPTPKLAPVDPFAYEALRELDEKENWAERAEVIFKTEHEKLVDLSREILDDLIRSLPIRVVSPATDGVVLDSVPLSTDTTEDKDTSFAPPSTPVEPRTMSEEIPIPRKGKSIYEMTDEELANMNPFASSNQMSNSPPVKSSGKSIYELSDEDLEKMNPFATKQTVQNSPPRHTADMNANAMQEEVKPENDKDDTIPEDADEEEKKDEGKKATPVEKLVEEEKSPPKKSPNKKPTKLKGPRKTGKKPSPKKETESVPAEPSPEIPLEEGKSQEITAGDENMNHGGIDAGVTQNDLLTSTQADDSIPDITEEEFKPGTEVFASDDQAALDIDFLEKMGQSNDFHASALARQSLYVKFDPLMKDLKQKPIGTLPESALPPAILEGEDLLMMSTPSPKKTSAPAPERVKEVSGTQETGVDKLLSYSPSRDDVDTQDDSAAATEVDGKDDLSLSLKAEDEGIVQPLRYSQADLEAAIETKTRIALEQCNKEWKKKMAEHNKQMQEMAEQIKSLEKSNAEMRALTAEYEKAMQQLMGDITETKSSSDDKVQVLQREKDQALEDLSSVENAFSDLHKRYEKLKGTVQGYKKNEDILKKCVEDHQAQLKKQEQKYQTLKGHAEDKIRIANEEIDKMKKSYGAEISGLQASYKREQLKVASLERTVEEKTKENTELTNICDELISKVGGGGQ